MNRVRCGARDRIRIGFDHGVLFPWCCPQKCCKALEGERHLQCTESESFVSTGWTVVSHLDSKTDSDSETWVLGSSRFTASSQLAHHSPVLPTAHPTARAHPGLSHTKRSVHTAQTGYFGARSSRVVEMNTFSCPKLRPCSFYRTFVWCYNRTQSLTPSTPISVQALR